MYQDSNEENKIFEAKTLEEVYEKASSSLNCSVNDLDIEVVQSPSKGFLGFFSKNAIIKVNIKLNSKSQNNKKEFTPNENKNVKVETLTTKLNELNSNNKTDKKESKKVKEQVKKEKIFDEFYDSKEQSVHKTPTVKKSNQKLEDEIHKDVNELFSKLCYKIDEIKVKIQDDDTSSNNGPPEFPGFIAASVWIIDLIVLPARVGNDLFRLEMIPVVRVRSRPNGFPIAKTF